MRLELHSWDLEHPQLHAKSPKFKQFKPAVQAAIVLCGRGTYQYENVLKIISSPTKKERRPQIAVAMPETWDTVNETLALDAESASFDDDVRASITKALNSITFISV